jgi:hypothetical protein
MRLLICLISLSLLGGLCACEPKPPKPRTDLTHERSNR